MASKPLRTSKFAIIFARCEIVDQLTGLAEIAFERSSQARRRYQSDMSGTYFVIGSGNCINAEATFTYRPCRRGAAVVAPVPEDDILLTIISRRKWRPLGWIFVIGCRHSNFVEMVDQQKQLLSV
jgi:hypothetical protein